VFRSSTSDASRGDRSTTGDRLNTEEPMPVIGLGSFNGDPRNPLDLMYWIRDNVDCYAGIMPKKVTESVYNQLRGFGASAGVISTAMEAARILGYDFHDDHVWLHDYTPPSPHESPSYATMTSASPPTEYDLRRTAEIIDSKYEIARLNGNTVQMESLAEALLQLLKGIAKMKEARGKFNEAQEEVLRYAPNVAPILRIYNSYTGPDGRTIHELIGEDANLGRDEEEKVE
jgi:hypothetical protein